MILITIILSRMLVSSLSVIQCQQNCQKLAYFQCTICYKNCLTPETSSFQMISCLQRYCAYRDSDGVCQYEQRYLSEGKCIQSCCAEHYNNFTHEIFDQCVQYNESQAHRSNQIGMTLIILIGVIIGVAILIIVICCCKGKTFRKYKRRKREREREKILQTSENQVKHNLISNYQSMLSAQTITAGGAKSQLK